MDKGIIERIDIEEDSIGKFDFSVNGIKNGSSAEDLKAAFGLKSVDTSTVTIVDTNSSENVLTFHISDGKVSEIKLDMWEY